MNDRSAPTLADQVAAIDVEAVVELILARPRHGAISASMLAIIAMAQRIADLDAVAAGTAELLQQIDTHRGIYAIDTILATDEIAPVVETLTGALMALGYVQPAPPSLQGDDQ